MRSGLATRGGQLLADRRGATLVEFAFVAAPLAALIVAVVQTSMVFFAQQTLETATEKSVRQLMTGQAQKAGMTQAQFKTLVCSKLPDFMGGSKCSANLLVDVQTASNFSDIATTPPTITYDKSGNPNNSMSYTPGAGGSVNIVRVMYVWNTQPGPLSFDLSNLSGKRRLLYSTSVFKTEPYSS